MFKVTINRLIRKQRYFCKNERNSNNIINYKNPINIHLILDGGALNGLFELGSLLYLKELERNNYINVSKISATSIGSLLGYLYLTDDLDKGIHIFNKLKHLLNFSQKTQTKREKYYFYELLKTELLHTETDKQRKINNDIFKDKLYISFFDVEKREFSVKSEYINKKDIIETIAYSTYVPYVCGNRLFFKDNYADGVFPHLFDKYEISSRDMVMYINISSVKYLPNLSGFFSKNDGKISRIIQGIVETHKYFKFNGENTDFCINMNHQSSWLAFISFTYLSSMQNIIKHIVFKNIFITMSYFSHIDEFINNMPHISLAYNVFNEFTSDIRTWLFKKYLSKFS